MAVKLQRVSNFMINIYSTLMIWVETKIKIVSQVVALFCFARTESISTLYKRKIATILLNSECNNSTQVIFDNRFFKFNKHFARTDSALKVGGMNLVAA